MARRVLLAPHVLRVSHPGFDAATAAIEQLIFSSNNVALGGSASGEIYIEASPRDGQNQLAPVGRSIPLPPGTGIPIVWVWDARADLKDTGYGYGAVLVFYDAAQQNLLMESRAGFPSWIGYMIYRNRSQ